MKKLISVVAMLWILTRTTYAQDTVAIRNCFQEYKKAIVTGNGKDAVLLVDKNTVAYFDNILILSKTADSSKVESLPLMDKLMVLSIRHNIPKNEIGSFNGNSLFVYAVEKGMIGKNGVQNLGIGKITVNGSSAKAPVLAGGQKAPFHFMFNKEKDQWKLDLTSIFDVTNSVLKTLITQTGQNENNLILTLLESVTGKKPKQDIWRPFN